MTSHDIGKLKVIKVEGSKGWKIKMLPPPPSYMPRPSNQEHAVLRQEMEMFKTCLEEISLSGLEGKLMQTSARL